MLTMRYYYYFKNFGKVTKLYFLKHVLQTKNILNNHK